jgi:hypothetical protein
MRFARLVAASYPPDIVGLQRFSQALATPEHRQNRYSLAGPPGHRSSERWRRQVSPSRKVKRTLRSGQRRREAQR